MHEHSRKPLDVGHIIGGYDILRVIGQGGFGIVYEGFNATTRERVAIKQFYPNAIATWQNGTIVVNREDDKELLQKVLKRFQEEAALQFNFNHPNILRVKNFIRADNTGYMITEFIEGSTLVDFLMEYGAVFPEEHMFRRTIEPILDALGYVHEKLTLHRDISPDNIMMEKSGRAVLVDFGAAKLDLRLSPSSSSLVQYKPDYAPLEQQVPSTERPEGYYTDIFAIAGTMYRLLTGKPPERAVARALASNDPYVPVSRASKIKCSPAVFEAIDRGLMMAAAQRPATIAVFKQMLGWEGEWQPSVSGLTPWQPSTVTSQAVSEVVTEPPLSEDPPEDVPSSTPELDEEQPSLVPPAASPDITPSEPENTPPLELPPEDQSPLPQPVKSQLGAYLGVILLLSGILGALVLSNSGVSNNTISSPDPAPVTPPAPVIRYLTYNNNDIDGGDFPNPPQLRGTDQSACEAACTDRSGCMAYVYDKWQRLCYLKQTLPDLRFDPSYNAYIRTEWQPPSRLDAPRVIQRVQQTLTGSIYSTTSASSRQACSDTCGSDDACFGYQYAARQKSCARYSDIDDVSAIDRSVQAGVKRQAAPR